MAKESATLLCFLVAYSDILPWHLSKLSIFHDKSDLCLLSHSDDVSECDLCGLAEERPTEEARGKEENLWSNRKISVLSSGSLINYHVVNFIQINQVLRTRYSYHLLNSTVPWGGDFRDLAGKEWCFKIYPSAASAVNLHHVYGLIVLRDQRGKNVSLKNCWLTSFL